MNPRQDIPRLRDIIRRQHEAMATESSQCPLTEPVPGRFRRPGPLTCAMRLPLLTGFAQGGARRRGKFPAEGHRGFESGLLWCELKIQYLQEIHPSKHFLCAQRFAH